MAKPPDVEPSARERPWPTEPQHTDAEFQLLLALIMAAVVGLLIGTPPDGSGGEGGTPGDGGGSVGGVEGGEGGGRWRLGRDANESVLVSGAPENGSSFCVVR